MEHQVQQEETPAAPFSLKRLQNRQEASEVTENG